MNHPPTDATRLRLVAEAQEPQPTASRDQNSTEPFAPKPALSAIGPSWLLSLVLHAGLFVVLALSLPGLRGGIVGDPDGDLRSVGIWVGHSGDGTDGDGGSRNSSAPKPPAAETKLVSAQKKDAPRPTPQVTPPSVATLPTAQPVAAPAQAVATSNPIPPSPIVGPGRPLQRPGLFQPSDEPQSAGKGGAAGAGRGSGRRGSRGSTPFFGIVDIGSRFVYVIDCSGSMYSHSALGAARTELLKSLHTLNRFQQFQVVFYNTEQRWLKMPGKVDFRFFAADEKNLRLASQFAAEIEPEGGTVHLTAIGLALRLHPDVIFFLTDGGKPGLTAFDLEELKRLNEGHTHIHCVQFRSDDDPDAALAADFLHKLAAQSDGEYVCRDVSQFDAPHAAPTVSRPRGEEH